MTKAELVDKIAAKTGMTKKDSAAALDAVLDSVAESLKNGDKVSLVGFGSFEVRKRAARTGRDPRTGQEIKIEARKVPVFRAGKALKDAVS
ncbi:MAG TPA: HU family DNA-binding protein [Firmicutes bacterium]|nr:HU family DNA-binding protein [Bacillota bacterium]HHY98389.1 HU family DNA-binding protein [Bacillota bacterium]